MDFYLIRHGKTDFNEMGFYQGCLLNPSLNDVGKAQLKELSKKLYDFHIDKIYSSPMRRAYESAKILFPFDGFDNIIIKSSLTEGDFGIIEGMRESDIKEKYPNEFEQWKDLDNLSFKFPKGQSKQEIGVRMYNALFDIKYHSLVTTNSVFIVTHSASIRCLLLNLGIKEYDIPFGTIYHFDDSGSRLEPLKFIERINLL